VFLGCFQIVAVEATADNLATIQQQHSISDGCVYRLEEGEFVMPGFIDTHIHAQQYHNAVVGYDKQLLEWLKNYTFHLEKQFSDLSFAEKVYEAIVVSELQL
jgi:guanine deaminase